MNTGVRHISNFVLYSSLWIALCAAAQIQLTYDLTGIPPIFDDYTTFVFASTLAMYCVHRIIGIRRTSAFEDAGRFAVIKQFRSHIILYGLAGTGVAGYYLTRLPADTLKMLAIPVLISIAYVVPLKKGAARLRDIPFVKIFLIAVNWALLTTVIPVIHNGADVEHLWAVFAERFLFIVAITIPFDIRDLTVDKVSGVRTIPLLIGPAYSKILALVALALSVIIVAILTFGGTYPSEMRLPYLAGIFVTATLIRESKEERDDHYFSGLLDGTLFLIPFFIWVWMSVIN